MKHHWTKSTWLAIVAGTILLLILTVTNPNALWIILSVPLVLFLPGFALTVILFPRHSLGIPERFLLSVGLSVTFTALAGLVLAWTPWGLQAGTLWTAFLLTFAVEVLVILVIRRNWWKEGFTMPAGVNFNGRQWVLMALAAIMTIMAIRVASLPAPQQGLEGYTLLWIKAENTPDTVRVGVESEEFNITTYQVKYEFNGTLRDGPTFQLKPGESWERVVSIPVDELVGSPFTVLLYRLNDPSTVYRRVEWWPESP